jgi:hypothetical protein
MTGRQAWLPRDARQRFSESPADSRRHSALKAKPGWVAEVPVRETVEKAKAGDAIESGRERRHGRRADLTVDPPKDTSLETIPGDHAGRVFHRAT